MRGWAELPTTQTVDLEPASNHGVAAVRLLQPLVTAAVPVAEVLQLPQGRAVSMVPPQRSQA